MNALINNFTQENGTDYVVNTELFVRKELLTLNAAQVGAGIDYVKTAGKNIACAYAVECGCLC